MATDGRKEGCAENLTEIMLATHQKKARQEISKKGKKVTVIQVNLHNHLQPCPSNTALGSNQYCGAGAGLFFMEPVPMKMSRLRAVAMWVRGSEVAELRQFL